MPQSCTADGLRTQRLCANLQYGECQVDRSKMAAASTCLERSNRASIYVYALFDCSRYVSHLGTINLMSFTIIINEYSKIYKLITCCCRRTQSMRSNVRRPFQKWRMAYVSRPIETVANEASRYVYLWSRLNFSCKTG